MTLWQLLKSGGVTLYVLLFLSVVSCAVIIERYIYYALRSKAKRTAFMKEIARALERGDIRDAIALCKETNAPFSSVARAGLHSASCNNQPPGISSAMERETAVETIKLEKFTGIIGTIGSTAVYIGLFGTVLGIMRAFRDIAAIGSGGMNVVINGISEALICTAAGLCIAVPAVIAYNYFSGRISNFVSDMELCASETADLLCAMRK